MTRRTAGFSLVEMLAAMAVGVFLLLAAAALLGQAGRGYERGSGGMAAEREGRAALTQIAADLSKTVRAPMIEQDPGPWKRTRLGILCLQPPGAQSASGRLGDACAVHYYVKDLETGGATVRCLMRGFRESAEVFAHLADAETDPLFDPRDQDEPIAFGIVSFEAETLSLSPSNRRLEPSEPDTDSPVHALRLKLVIARRELSGRLQRPDDWDAHPVLGDPARPQDNRHLEVHELTQRFGADP